jgi:nucleotidyltransferase/DNA polymerase involved in DNA repair
MTDGSPEGSALWPRPGPGPTPPPDRWIVYVDLDAYYVSCEVRDRPELAGQAVIVGPPPGDRPSRGVVLSASYEARAFGVHSAMPVAAAAVRCPTAIWIAPDFPKYERVSREVRGLLGRHSPDVVPFSIDEAAVTVVASDASAARAAAERIQRDLRERLRLPASLGVATTRVVAKIATDRAKPGGIVVVPPEEVAAFVAPLPVRAVPGIGPKTEARIRDHGLLTIGDFAGLKSSEVARWLGGFGRELVALARGNPRDAPIVASGPRSRSTDRTFDADVGRWEEIVGAVASLARELGEGLARDGTRYGSVGVGFRWADFSRSQRIRTLAAAAEGPGPLERWSERLARELWTAEQSGAGRAVRTVSVRVERLSGRPGRQASLDDFGRAVPPRG